MIESKTLRETLTREVLIRNARLAKPLICSLIQPENGDAMAVLPCRETARSLNGANGSVDGGWPAERPRSPRTGQGEEAVF